MSLNCHQLKQTERYKTINLHALYFHRNQSGLGTQSKGIGFCVRNLSSDPEGETEVLVFRDEYLEKIGLDSLMELPENPKTKEILCRTYGPQRHVSFCRIDINGDGFDEVVLTGKGGAANTSLLIMFVINNGVSVIYSNSSRSGFTLLDIDHDGTYEILGASSVAWKITNGIKTPSIYHVYKYDNEKGKFKKHKSITSIIYKEIVKTYEKKCEFPLTTKKNGGSVMTIYADNSITNN